ncbi:MAG: hypothetical protein RBG13Loki_3700 [Promethearchaeota archaeon CR_4]|nr:MAG: hypothetical protein RBG13Loki_3700 [Candidatus Lokiarchaeota archaeon CR_4]
MRASDVYQDLEKDFIAKGLSDDWARHMGSVVDYLCDNFKIRSMGLVCDFTEEITKIYTAVFPSKKIMNEIIHDNVKDAMLFVHHPSIWDIRNAPQEFQQIDKGLLEKFKQRRIAIYNLHVPLDNNGVYSTSMTLTKTFGIVPEKYFCPYFGALCGIIGTAEDATIGELKIKLENAVGHSASHYPYSDEIIRGRKIAVIAGGGFEVEMLEEIAINQVNAFITGITATTPYSRNAHEFAKKHNINLLGATHYSTEKFACIAMCDYFEKLKLPARFICDDPVLEDM